MAKTESLDQLSAKDYIIIKGARVNNLKNLSLAIPRNKMVVITGVSGSGKSSLAFDTLFAEGQRMYVESLSSYARQFVGRMEKPDVDFIKGVSPAIAVEQKVTVRNARSTVGTSTEIFDYLRLLFARVGKTYSPISGNEVKKDTVSSVVDELMAKPEGSKFLIYCPMEFNAGRSLEDELKILLQKGYSRVVVEGAPTFIEDCLEDLKSLKKKEICVLVDRVSIAKGDEELVFRLSDSVQTAFFEGKGYCFVSDSEGNRKVYSDRFECDGISFEEPSVNFFSFNNPYGICRRCDGYGTTLDVDPDLVFPDKNLSVFEGAIAPWKTEKMSEWLVPLVKNGIKFDFPIHRPVNLLTEEEYQLLWTGNKFFSGLNDFFQYLEKESHKIQYRVLYSRYRNRVICPDCKGTRIRKDASYVKLGGKSIQELLIMPISDLMQFFEKLELNKHETAISQRLLTEINNRLRYVNQVGLGYLTLNRITSTLSGGEYQRIKLATSLGSALVGSMYILDEPSIGLHPRDTQNLIEVLKQLRDMGNTVIVVEHEEEIMRACDQIIDIGPDAGERGGHLVYQGSAKIPKDAPQTHTTRFLAGTDTIPYRKRKKQWVQAIQISKASENNLKQVNLSIPTGIFVAVSGVSGSGKSTLVKQVLYPAVQRELGASVESSGKVESVKIPANAFTFCEIIDQNPIGKSSRSNPVTYTKAYEPIRILFANQPKAKQENITPGHFSFNVDSGRCEKCQGEGIVTIQMQFMADIHLQCESCKGKRFKESVLEVYYKGKNISEVLAMTVEEAMDFFADQPKITERISPLMEVGLGYIRLGQSSSSLSGGEAQRVKLATYLIKGETSGNGLFIFDEPTTGLHFHDIAKLLKSLHTLVDRGHSVLVIEHNLDVLENADWLIDMGPEGGNMGGYVCFEGTPEDLLALENNHTAAFLRKKKGM